MNSVTLDWLDMIVIFSVFAACAVVGWLAACLMSRVEAVKPREPREPMAPLSQLAGVARLFSGGSLNALERVTVGW
jgi:hypothetical protein